MNLPRFVFIAIVFLAGCSGGNSVTGTGKPPPATLACTDNPEFFRTRIWQDLLQPKCFSCHSGIAGKMLLLPASDPDYLQKNFDSFAIAADKKTETGLSFVVAKPQQLGTNHPIKVLGASDQTHIDNLVKISDSLSACKNANANELVFETPFQHLRKITLNLAGRLPTADETASVSAADTSEARRAALDTVVDGLYKEPGFEDRLRQVYNDLLLTDRYIGRNLSNLSDMFPRAADYTDQALMDLGYTKLNSSGATIVSDAGREIQRRLRFGLARAALELIVHTLRNDRPFGNILTADYIMVSPYTAYLLDVSADDNQAFAFDHTAAKIEDKDIALLPARDDFRPATISFADKAEKLASPLGPQAGILTNLAFLQRYPSTSSNRNRHRTRITMKYFLDTDAESLGDRSQLDLDNIIEPGPYADPQCRQCHDTIDPIAGMFKNRGFTGGYGANFLPDCSKQDANCPGGQVWYSDRNTPSMLKPGYTMANDDALAVADYPDALPKLAARIVADERFVRASIKWIFHALTGQSLETLPAMEEQLKQVFQNTNGNLKEVIRTVIHSDYFRAANLSTSANADNYAEFGMGRLQIPEQLYKKVEAVFGYAWRSPSGRQFDGSLYGILYGGIDSDQITERSSDPTPVMAAIQDRLALQTACAVVARDFSLAAAERRLFPHVEITDVPDDGGMTAKIKENLQHLYRLVLGEELESGDAQIGRAYQLFQDARAAMPATSLDAACRGGLANDNAIVVDSQGTVRAWMTLVGYLIIDYRFLYE